MILFLLFSSFNKIFFQFNNLITNSLKSQQFFLVHFLMYKVHKVYYKSLFDLTPCFITAPPGDISPSIFLILGNLIIFS